MKKKKWNKQPITKQQSKLEACGSAGENWNVLCALHFHYNQMQSYHSQSHCYNIQQALDGKNELCNERKWNFNCMLFTKSILKTEIKIASNERAWGTCRIDPWWYNCPVHLSFSCYFIYRCTYFRSYNRSYEDVFQSVHFPGGLLMVNKKNPTLTW